MPLQLLEGMSSRKRRPNWTDQECLLLARLMQERKDIIRGKCNTGISVQDKRQAWEEITQAINTAFPQMQRTVSDCNKKWENLLAKSREEIKRQKRQSGADEGVSLDQFSTVTQIVISVMNLSDILQQQRDDSPAMQQVEFYRNRGGKVETSDTTDEEYTDKPHRAECLLPAYTADQSPSPPGQKINPFSPIPKSLSLQFTNHNAAVFTAAGEPLGTPCSTSTPSVQHSTTLQERMDLEVSVLRRQEAVLKLQEEYYALKIKLMKKQMADSSL